MKFEKFAEIIEKSLVGVNLKNDFVIMDFDGYAYPIEWIGIKKMFEDQNTGKRKIEEKYLFENDEILSNCIDKNALSKAKFLYHDYDVFYHLKIHESASRNIGKIDFSYNISPIDYLEYEFADADFDKIKILNSNKNNIDTESFRNKNVFYINKFLKCKYENAVVEFENVTTNEFGQIDICDANKGCNGIPLAFTIVNSNDYYKFVFDNNFIKNGYCYDIAKFGMPSGVKRINDTTIEVKNYPKEKIRIRIIEDPAKNFKDMFEGWV